MNNSWGKFCTEEMLNHECKTVDVLVIKGGKPGVDLE